jgi:hypothetical protein
MQRLPTLISLFTVVFFIFSLTGNVIIADPTFSNVAFAQKGKNKNKDKDKDQDKNKLKGNKRLRAAVADLQGRVDTLETAPPVPGVPGPKGDKGDQGDPGADSFVVGPKGDKGDKGDPGQDGKDGSGSGYVLQDANGEYIGDIMSFNLDATGFMTHLKYLTSDGNTINIVLQFKVINQGIDTNGIDRTVYSITKLDGGNGRIYFSSRDCTGNPMLNFSSRYGSLFTSAFITQIDNDPNPRLYIQKSKTAVQTGYSSYRFRDGACTNRGGNQKLYSAKLVDDRLFETFPPPFNVVPVR